MSDFFQQIADLSPEQRALFEKRFKQKGFSSLKAPEISKIEIYKRKDYNELPLSFAQQRLWFFQQLNPDNSAYNVFSALRLEGQLNVGLLEKVFTEIVRRHESLRTTFLTNSEGQPVQIVATSQSITLPIIDLKEAPYKEQEAQRLAIAEVQRPFDLTKPLLRITLLQLQKTEYVLLVTIHHIISDRWSLGVFVQETKVLYEAFSSEQPSPLPDLPIQYADWAIWQQQYLQGEVLSSQMAYWKQQLANLPILQLPTDRPRPAVATYQGAKQSFDLSKALSKALKALSAKEGVTLFTLLLAAFTVLLHKYTNQNDIVVGTDIANRNRIETEGLIGFLINTLVLRTYLGGNPTFRQLLSRVREVTLKAYDHQDLSFDKLVDVLNTERDLSQMVPLFQVKFDLQLAKVEPLELSDLTVSPLAFDNGTAKFELRFNLSETEQGIKGLVEYSTDLFDTNTISRMVEHFLTLVEGIVASPQQRLSDLSLLIETERHQLVLEWNDTQADYPTDTCIHQFFEAQVERTPDAVAVVFEDQQLTYWELNSKANQLAHYLQKLGVGPEVLVGICVERSLSMVIGLLGILKAGGAYVPLDPAYPQERLSFILEDAQVPVLLTQGRLVEAMPQHKAKVICLDTDWQTIAQKSKENSVSEVTPNNLAYVIYTSGSTGRPKGVQIPHTALSNFLQAMKQTPGLTEQDTLLAVTTYSFDIAALELFLPITVGARLLLVSREVAWDGTRLSALLTDSNVTIMQATPATWQLLLAAGWQGNHQLKILCGGEALPGHVANQLLKRCDSLWNMYGPTETTIWSAACLVETESGIVPISHPIANTQFHILDQDGQLVPVGVPGELHIGGDGLARGYLNRPELTAEKFIPNPFIDNSAACLYKTGDLARYLPNGEIEYLGRIDHQVKVRGFRIELGEIEAAISQHPKVRDTVVAVRSDSADSQRLVAYVVPQNEQTLTMTELRDFLESKLPNYMVPVALVMLEGLPLTPNGKVDRKALRAPEVTQLLSESDFVAPSTPIEEMLAGIWAEVLGIEKVGIHNNFFTLGGHSLVATRVISQVRQVFQLDLPIRRLFEQPTIAGLALDIEKATKAGNGLETAHIERISRSQELPLSFAQQRLWFLTQLEPNSPFYNIPGAVRLQGQLNLTALQQSFNEILRRHEALRTNLQTIEGLPVAIISSVTSLPLPIFDITELPSNQQQAEVRKLADKEAQRPFDLNSDLLLRVKLLRLGEQEHILLLTMHHIASDGWSVGVLVREVAALYQAFSTGQPSPLPELPIQYADFAAWQGQWLQGEVLESQMSYWRKQLEGAPTVLELPTDHPRPAVQTFRGATYSFELSLELSAALNKLSQREGATLFMTLLAAFMTLLWRYTGSEDIVVGSPIANRNRAEIEGLIGLFVNTQVLRTNLAGNPTFWELLTRVREIALGAYAHQDLPFEQLVEELQPQRDLSHTPLFQVMFALQNAPMSALELPGLTLSLLASESGSAKFDLTLFMTETALGLVGTLEYSTDVFESSTISRMAEHLQTLLEGIVANPQQRLSDLPLLSEAEKALLVQWNDTSVKYPQHQCIHQLFEAQVQRTPDAVAVVFESEQLTYCELNAKANQLAYYLQKVGVGPEVLVGICTERSLDMVIGLLGILKAGGAYVPLDPTYPQERLSFILEDAQVPVLLTQRQLVEPMPQHKAKVVCLDTDWQIILQESKENSVSEVTANNLAYVIYTSGSTGRPKGVMIKHQSTVAMLDWAQKTFAAEALAGVLASTSICFDLSVFEIFVPLNCGGKVILVENALHLPTLPTAKNVTLINTVPSIIAELLRFEGIPASVHTINIAGEPLQNKLVQQLYQWDNIQQVFNLYGPSEDTTYSTFAWIQKGTSNIPPIGNPISNTQVYLLDQKLQLVPVGVPGELYIGGDGLARGYLNRPELTAEKFISNPFSKKSASRLYKTGDLARYLSNGEIEYLGRIDHQVKIRGFRIESGEIEAVLTQHPTVGEAVVVVREDVPGDKRLVAYVVFQQELTSTFNELRNFLKENLPDYMVPAAFVPMKALPLTPNGKVDRKALPAPDSLHLQLETTYIKPQTDLEKSIATVWQKALKIEKVGIHDNFFDLGGHSLLMVQVHSQLHQIFPANFSIIELFRYTTISSLAEFLNPANKNEPSSLHQTDARTEQLKDGKTRIKQFLTISKRVK